MIYYHGQNCGESNQKFDSKVILLTTDGSLVSDKDQVNVGVKGRGVVGQAEEPHGEGHPTDEHDHRVAPDSGLNKQLVHVGFGLLKKNPSKN